MILIRIEKKLEEIVLGLYHFFKSKPKKAFVYVVTPIILISLINFTDFFLLPTKSITDRVVSVHASTSNNGWVREIHYATEKGYSFSTTKVRIYDIELQLKTTQLFRSITQVRSAKKDYSSYLSSDLNGFRKYLNLFFIISLIIGILILESGRRISDNTFLNIVLFNALTFLALLYMHFLY